MEVTEAIYMGIFSRRAFKLKFDWDIKNPRDGMTDKELMLVAQVEDLTSRLIDQDNMFPLAAVSEALKRLIIPICIR